MRERLTAAAVPAYILLCLLIGGSVQGILFNLALQLLGLALISWAWIEGRGVEFNRPAKGILLLFLLLVVLFLLHLIPLPASVWTLLPGREAVVQGFRELGMPLPSLPLSLTPQATFATLLTLIPPFAVLSAMLLLRPQRPTWIAAIVLIVTAAGVLLGTLQVGSSNPWTSPWYLYDFTNFGNAVGFFANSNHMASLLAISIPFLFGLVRRKQILEQDKRAKFAAWMLLVAGSLVLAVGLVLNRSSAGLVLLPLVASFGALILFPPKPGLRRLVFVGGAVLTLFSFALLLSPARDRLGFSEDRSVEVRRAIWSDSYAAGVVYAPFGSGIGSYRRVIASHEDPKSIEPTVTNNAHNDYLEIFVEAGLPGLILLALFFVWWARHAKSVWRKADEALVQAAVIASGALLLHSLVDYPLRTAALSTVMAACLAMMVRPASMRASGTEDLWPTRHVKL